MLKYLSILLLTITALALSGSVMAHVRLPAVFSDHMVLQQRAQTAFWGWADPGERIIISSGWTATSVTTQADASGKWSVKVPTPAAGGPFTIHINDLELKDILVGEVWLCSGQSNMVFSLKGAVNAKEEIPQADYPDIRYFSVTRQYAGHTFDDSPGATWISASPKTAPSFSAVAYFFAKKLHAQLHVPIGIIYSAWGGTPAEAWTEPAVMQKDTILTRYFTRWKYIQDNVGRDSVAWHEALDKWQQAHPGTETSDTKTDDQFAAPAGDSKKPAEPQTHYYYVRPWREPGVLFNGMINPIIPFTIKGVLWYQGESNVSYADEYLRLMTAMIDSWRARWGANFPFYVVQISAYGYASLDAAARLREAEYEISKKVPNTGTAVTADLGNMKDIHYTRKKEVGDRLALIALARDYGQKKQVYKSPEFKKATASNGKITVEFEPSTAGLEPGTATPGTVKGFELGYRAPTGDSLLYQPANAKIDGNKVIVWNDAIKDPIAVRYAWLLVGEANLFNTEGLPAFPFRATITK